MRNIRFLSLLLLALLALAVPVRAEPAATAAEAPAAGKFAPAVIAVVDIQKILHESLAAKAVREQLGGKRQTYQKQVTADEQKLREAEQELTKQRGTLSQEQFAEKRRAFEEKVRQAQQGVQERARVLDTAFNEALGTIRQNLGQVVADAAKERGVTLVLDKGQVVVVESSFDITDIVLERLNRKLPTVSVNLPANGAPPAKSQGGARN